MPDINQMLQAIIGLGQLQQSRREQDLRAMQFEEGKKQFAQSFGLQEGDQKFKQILQLVDKATSASSTARGGWEQLGQALNLPANILAAVGSIDKFTPQSIEMLRTMAANEGYAHAGPQGQQQMNAEAASGAVTGMNQGQIAQSGTVNAALGGGQAQGAFQPNTVASLQQGLGIRTATGQDPLAFNIGQVISQNPQLLNTLARIQAGKDITESERQNIGVAMRQVGATIRGQDVGAQVGMYGHNVQAMLGAGELGVREFSARQGGMVNPQQQLEALTRMQAAVTSSQAAKTKGEMQMLTSIYNAAVSTGFPDKALPISQGGMLITDPDQLKDPTLLDKARALAPHAIGPGQGYTVGPAPGGPPLPFQFNPQAGAPAQFQASPYATQPYSIMQFLQSMPGYQPPPTPK